MTEAAAAPGFWDWTFDPALALVLLTALLYALGSTRTVTPARTGRERRVRSGCFYLALALLAIALNSPLDALAEQLFWVHMVQHVLLLLVAPPLIIVARPWTRLWRFFPLGARRSVGRGLAQSSGAAPLRALSRWLGRPSTTFVLFSGVLLAWHVPALFNATLHSEAVHALEHGMFFFTALMFWKQVIHSPPLHAPLSDIQRVAYLVGAMVVSWALAVFLALAPHPLYPAYAHELSRPGGISALADQQIAAGIMWVPGSVSFLIVLFIYVHRWLTPAQTSPRASRLAGEH